MTDVKVTPFHDRWVVRVPDPNYENQMLMPDGRVVCGYSTCIYTRVHHLFESQELAEESLASWLLTQAAGSEEPPSGP